MDSMFYIRQAKIDDVSAIAQVSYLTWLHAYRGIIPDEELDTLNLESVTEKWVQILNMAVPRGGTYVVISDESIVAYSRFYPSVDSDDDPDRVVTIGSMYVHPHFQHQGIGSRLMSKVLAAGRRQEFVEATLHVLTANERARKFYEHLGWEHDLDAILSGSDEETGPRVRYRRNPL